jgi:hypothetical protein
MAFFDDFNPLISLIFHLQISKIIVLPQKKKLKKHFFLFLHWFQNENLSSELLQIQ